jgi:hypothetical protein
LFNINSSEILPDSHQHNSMSLIIVEVVPVIYLTKNYIYK